MPKTWLLAPLFCLTASTARAHPPNERAPCPEGQTNTPTSAIDLNRAPAQALAKLPGVGPKLAARIVEARAKRPFRSMQDVLRVKGIGRRTLARLRPWLEIEVRASSGTRSPGRAPPR